MTTLEKIIICALVVETVILLCFIGALLEMVNVCLVN